MNKIVSRSLEVIDTHLAVAIRPHHNTSFIFSVVPWNIPQDLRHTPFTNVSEVRIYEVNH